MDAKMMILACFFAVAAFAAESPSGNQDLKTAESSRFFSWSGTRPPQYTPNYPNNWYYGNGYQYPNYFHQYNPGYPSTNYPNYGYGNNGYSNNGYGGYPGGYGYTPGFGNWYNPGFGSGFGGYNSRYKNQDIAQQTTARGGYVY